VKSVVSSANLRRSRDDSHSGSCRDRSDARVLYKKGAASQAAPIENALIEAADRVAQNENFVVSVKERGWMMR